MNTTDAKDINAIPWETAKDFTDLDTGITIRVNSRQLPPKFEGAIPLKQYSWELLRLRQDGKTMRHFPAICNVDDGRVSIDPFPIGRFSVIMDQAESWVIDERQRREDDVTERRITRR